ncbi:DUF6455 family protein [Litorivita sp. NS0012-18]|uniref:DUF6455 family protein n=1 Tax=Litorivita sp. NS0012-18 TaxID=3127655 RepID=UPI0031032148
MTPSATSAPHPLGSRKRHYWLVQRMAAAAAVDLNAAFEAGDLGSDSWAQTIETCRGCDWVEGCEKWLAQEDEGRAAPATCHNRVTFEALKRGQDAKARDGAAVHGRAKRPVQDQGEQA